MSADRSCRGKNSRSTQYWILLGIVAALTLLTGMYSLSVGPTVVHRHEYWQAFTQFNNASDAHFVLRELRLPRAVLAGLVGACLATSGALMQGVTRNPLAGPSIMGLSAGGTLCLLIGLLVNPRLGYSAAIGLSLGGAVCGYLTVCSVTLLSRRGMTPAGFALAGAVVSAMFGAITHGLTIYFSLHDEMLYWTVGGVSHVSWAQVFVLLPVCLIGLVVALALSPAVTVLNLGEEIAAGLGQRTTLTRLGATFAVLLLTGGAIAVAGPVGFVGLMVPHFARMFAGVDYRRIIPLSVALGACLTMIADIASRSLVEGREVPLGLFTTLIGAPFFVYLARRRSSARNLDEGE
ncbi:putative siderophore transport system permease protein YfiZ precursor [Gimesia alba]|uniref:Putative siderophore transport system permease protein YfiZ n=1 Tax=Gimesia alba TaxID=2527973 RepID=A0A517RDN2_9PLAN|nr:iron ABC transporter permease [Gimesia alba]QDT41988.1 putative siderophore transport system permease protein YfiZ precursor [Gimesia alba]